MAKSIIFLWPIIFFFLNAPAKTYRIAVSELDPKGVSATEAAIITDFLRNDLFATGRFEVLERAKMNEILQEIAFQQTGCTTAECAVEMGKILNVEKMIVGSVSKLGDTYYISVRFVDVETGKIEFADRVSCKCPIDIIPTSITDLANKIANAVYENSSPLNQTRELSVTEGTGVLYIKTEPSDAEVYVDGNLKGTSPYVDTNIPAGGHYIKIKWKDGREKEDFVNIEPNEVKRLTYQPDESVNYYANKLIILSDPIEAEVFLDWKRIGITPLIKENINPGKHRLFLKKEGKYEIIEFEIEKGQTQTIRASVSHDFDLTKIKLSMSSFTNERLNLSSKYHNCKLFFNNQFITNLESVQEISLNDLLPNSEVLQSFLSMPNSRFLLIFENEIVSFSIENLLYFLKHSSDSAFRMFPKQLSISIIPPDEDYQVFFNDIKLGMGTIKINLNDLIRRNRLYLFEENTIICEKNRNYLYKKLNVDLENAGEYVVTFDDDASTVTFNIKPRPIILLINENNRIYDVRELKLEPGTYNFLLVPVKTSLKNKKYEKTLTLKPGDKINLTYNFND